MDIELFSKLADKEIWYPIIKVVIGFGLVLFFKGIAERWVAYYQFMSNKRLGIGVKVKVRNEEGKITDYDKKWIFVHNKEGDEIIVPIKSWISEKWTLINNGENK